MSAPRSSSSPPLPQSEDRSSGEGEGENLYVGTAALSTTHAAITSSNGNHGAPASLPDASTPEIRGEAVSAVRGGVCSSPGRCNSSSNQTEEAQAVSLRLLLTGTAALGLEDALTLPGDEEPGSPNPRRQLPQERHLRRHAPCGDGAPPSPFSLPPAAVAGLLTADVAASSPSRPAVVADRHDGDDDPGRGTTAGMDSPSLCASTHVLTRLLTRTLAQSLLPVFPSSFFSSFLLSF
eukprot:GHVU01192581.1.p1 GENE.GHVU01192581.1~~GHVU01192581.1.p1  ORF type:complete len:236 (-),score=22.11 GHVU01192581.1:203-910(-)